MNYSGVDSIAQFREDGTENGVPIVVDENIQTSSMNNQDDTKMDEVAEQDEDVIKDDECIKSISDDAPECDVSKNDQDDTKMDEVAEQDEDVLIKDDECIKSISDDAPECDVSKNDLSLETSPSNENNTNDQDTKMEQVEQQEVPEEEEILCSSGYVNFENKEDITMEIDELVSHKPSNYEENNLNHTLTQKLEDECNEMNKSVTNVEVYPDLCVTSECHNDIIVENETTKTNNKNESLDVNGTTVENKYERGNISRHFNSKAEVEQEDLPPSRNMQEKESEALLNSMGDTLKVIESVISVISEVIAFDTAQSYSLLRKQSISAHEAIVKLGYEIELGFSLPNGDVNPSILVLDESTREKLRQLGRKIWTLIKKHPSIFRDSVSSHQDTCQDPKDRDTRSLQVDRAIASGYVRSLAARLVLIERLRTRSLSVPVLIFKSGGDEPALPVASLEEMEFGLKSFSRAGNIMKDQASDPYTSYCTLSLGFACWEGIMAHVSWLKNDLYQSQLDSVLTVKNRCTDEAFDVLISIIDAAFHAMNREMKSNDSNQKQNPSLVGSGRNIISQLKLLEGFVGYELSNIRDSKDIQKEPEHIMSAGVQRLCLTLAKTSYKLGNRFAHLEEYIFAKEALKIAIETSEKYLARIKGCFEYGKEDIMNNFYQSLHIQEQETFATLKQSLYILSRSILATGDKIEALRKLERIENLIQEQSKRDDDLYTDTIRHLSKSTSALAHNIGSNIILEGPKRQDIADIEIRVQSVRLKSKQTAEKEAVNICFSRIQIYLSEQDGENLADDGRIVMEFKKMVDICISSYEFNPNGLSEHLCNTLNKDNALDKNLSDTFNICLVAARNILSKHLTTQKSELDSTRNPYDILCEVFKEKHQQHLQICLDYVGTIFTAVMSIKNTGVSSGDQRFLSNINRKAINLGKTILSNIQKNLTSCKRQNGSEKNALRLSTLFVGDSMRSIPESIFETVKIEFTCAVSLYHKNSDWEMVNDWCDLLLEILNLSKTIMTNPVNDSDLKKTISGILAIKAHSLTEISNYGHGLKVARQAAEMNDGDTGIIVTLFSCVVRYESWSRKTVKENGSNNPTSYSSLLELDDVIRKFVTSSKLQKDENPYKQLLRVFPVFMKSCDGLEDKSMIDILSFGLHQRWLNILLKWILDNYDEIRSDFSRGRYSLPGGLNVLTITRQYLSQFESLYLSVSEKTQNTNQYYSALLNILDETLKLITKIRDEKSSIKNSGLVIDTNSLWSDSLTNEIVGTQTECVWVAEQLWNIATQLLSCDSNATDILNVKYIAARYFSKAHDFIFIGEEEQGMMLTKGYLEYEGFSALVTEERNIDWSKKPLESTDICSEFSVQALVMSAANMIDFFHSLENDPEENFITLTIKILNAAYSEMNMLENNMSYDVKESLLWVSLNLLVIMKDDDFALRSLKQGGLSKEIEQYLKTPENASPCKYHSKDVFICLEHTFHVAIQAESKSMMQTARQLYVLCADALIYKHKAFISSASNSLGTIQRKILQLSTSVADVISVFDDIDKVMKRLPLSSDGDNENCVSYSVDDIDYFTIEAHNKAVSLLILGDLVHSETLLASALNLISFSGDEVKSHTSDINRTYRTVIERKGNGGGAFSMSSSSIINLFGVVGELGI